MKERQNYPDHKVPKALRYDGDGNRLCTACKRYLPVELFRRDNRIAADALSIYCKPCHNERVRRVALAQGEAFKVKAAARQRAYREREPERDRMHQRARRAQVRRDILEHYGAVCACCGETTTEFLGIDHVNGGGQAHRKEVGPGVGVYFWLRKMGYPSGFQILCHNCNLAKGFYGACPHTKKGIDDA